MNYEIIEIKGAIPLAFIKLANGKLRFINKFKIPVERRIAHFAIRDSEAVNPQANY